MSKPDTTKARARRTPEDRVNPIEHRGRVILHADFSHGEDDEVMDAFRRLRDLAATRTEPYCILYDVRGNYAKSDFVEFAKDFAAFTKEQGISTGSSVMGVTGIKRLLAKATLHTPHSTLHTPSPPWRHDRHIVETHVLHPP